MGHTFGDGEIDEVSIDVLNATAMVSRRCTVCGTSMNELKPITLNYGGIFCFTPVEFSQRLNTILPQISSTLTSELVITDNGMCCDISDSSDGNIAGIFFFNLTSILSSDLKDSATARFMCTVFNTSDMQQIEWVVKGILATCDGTLEISDVIESNVLNEMLSSNETYYLNYIGYSLEISDNISSLNITAIPQ